MVGHLPAFGLDLGLEGVGGGPVAACAGFGPLADEMGYLGRGPGGVDRVRSPAKDSGRGDLRRSAAPSGPGRQSASGLGLCGTRGVRACRRHDGRDRQQNRHPGAVRGDVLRPGFAAVGSGQLADDRQAQAGAAPGSRWIGSIEAFEDALQGSRAESPGRRR